METVDSKEQLLPLPEIITRVVSEAEGGNPRNLPLYVILVAIVKEATLETANVYQAGNTVFLGHVSPDKKKLVGRAFNIDTPNNFLDNGLKYFKYISKIGVRDYYTNFDNPSFASAFKYMEKSPIKDQIQVEVYPSKADPTQTVVHVAITGEIEV
jgi:hypothetical protein